jgi:hypothetical protein
LQEINTDHFTAFPMEETKTQEATSSTLQSWWEAISFPGKERYNLTDTGALTVTQNDKERTIANLTAGNSEATYKQLTDKYAELSSKVEEVSTEWDKTEDKGKLAGRVERLRENILHANAIGDLDLLAGKVSVWDKELSDLSAANYELKSALVAKAEGLSGADNFKEGTVAFRELIEEWKKIGYADKQRSDELWAKIEAAKDKFHERKRQYHEEQEKDMLQNLDLKLELVDKAEQLAASEEWKKTTEAYKELMDQWKATGPTMHDKNEELWARFSAAKTNFFDRKRAHGDQIGVEQEENYVKKLALVEQAEAMKDSTDWGKTSKAYAELMEEWKKIGRAPKEKGDDVWNRLNAAKEVFFNAKRQHFDAQHVEMDNNLIQKQALVDRANALKNSTNWRDTADEMVELMDEWKKIGPVQHKISDKIWEEFNGARKHFFARKDENREKYKQQSEVRQVKRVADNRNFLKQLEAELVDEEAKIVEFREALENVTAGPKEKELRAHLTNLISEIEGGLESKRAKIEKVKKEVEAQDEK